MKFPQNRRHKKRFAIFASIFILSFMLVASIFIPIPYFIEMPGSAEDVQQFVRVDGKSNDQTGAYLLTTVGIRQATPATFLLAKKDTFQEVIPERDFLGDNTSEEHELLGELQMSSSENMAKKVALDLAGETYHFSYKGIYVMDVMATSDFRGKLAVGDLVYQVDDLSFETTEEFMDYVASKELGETITLKIERDGEKKTISGKLTKLSEENPVGVGITLTEHTELVSDREITFEVEGIGGPSAGLMFTLEIYESLTGQSLRKGHVIAGTGEIRSDGKVGMIGGIDKKVVAADRAGAEIFFAPDESYSKEVLDKYPDLKNNYQQALAAAKKINTKMEIVPVKTVQDALEYMESLNYKDSE
ncbi:SepM family pheromone-processing serine protease [Vagococcus elongatus]|uniref:endopeptidase La n=1 Tax=Vagococcus elongatus TaxID=180344 RepID=A0A430B2C8_9ENTE|nr:SepM family pheromone-processing serine protease [Vagococcus elongatus]RSU14382.1 hypothetical protein CBF29_03530 [Vagococcus elongatus]